MYSPHKYVTFDNMISDLDLLNNTIVSRPILTLNIAIIPENRILYKILESTFVHSLWHARGFDNQIYS